LTQMQLSPLLSNIYNYRRACQRSSRGYGGGEKVWGRWIKALRFADDQAMNDGDTPERSTGNER